MTATHLHTYQCSLCKTVMVSVVKDRYRPCNGCLRWMKFLYSTPIETDEHRALAERGTVFNPNPPERKPWNCVRCGTEFVEFRPIYRTDGRCCQGCVNAEAIPPLLTPEQQAERLKKVDTLVQEDEDRMEAAYRALEGAHRE